MKSSLISRSFSSGDPTIVTGIICNLLSISCWDKGINHLSLNGLLALSLYSSILAWHYELSLPLEMISFWELGNNSILEQSLLGAIDSELWTGHYWLLRCFIFCFRKCFYKFRNFIFLFDFLFILLFHSSLDIYMFTNQRI